MAETEDVELGEQEMIHPNETERVRSEKFLTLYANQVHMANTPWDMQMMFSNLRAVSVNAAVIEELATIIMSPVHAKVMAQILVRQVQAYEAQYGRITLNLSSGDEDSKQETQKELDGEAETETKPKRQRRSK